MKIWLTTVITTSLLLSLIASLLPDNGVKRAVLTAFGFIFLAVIVSPVMGAVNNGISLDVLMLESIVETENSGEEGYISQVTDEYRSRLERECKKMLEDENLGADISIEVNGDSDSDSFGNIMWVKCTLYPGSVPIEKSNTVEKIVIDFDGIKINKENQEDYTEEQENAVKLISDFLGIEKEKVYVELG